jgi:hypothetical protein
MVLEINIVKALKGERDTLSVVVRECAYVLHCAYLILSLCTIPLLHLHDSFILWLN